MATGKRIEIDYNKIYESKSSGPFKIIGEEPSRKVGACVKRIVKVQFIETGTIRTAQLLMAIKGSVLDPYRRSTCGVGYLGDVENIHYSKKEYDIWYHMIKRCYDPNYDQYKFYGALGVTVCDRWLCFRYFLEDLPTILGYKYFINDTKNKYHLDKDYMQQNTPTDQKVYSPQTCIFIDASDNTRLAAITYRKNNECSSQYYGLYKTPYNTYQCSVMIDGKKYFLGTYSNEIAAATVYNYVMSNCCYSPTLNRLPYMDINEALKYRTGHKIIELPPTIDGSYLDLNPHTSSIYTGVCTKGNAYTASYCKDGSSISIGTFSNEIAAANAHNYYVSFYNDNSTINNVPYMNPAEWLKYKNYISGKSPVEMFKIVKK